MKRNRGDAGEGHVGEGVVDGDILDLLETESGRPARGLTGGLDFLVASLSTTWRRRFGCVIVTAVGLFLLVVPVYHISQHSVTVEAVFADALPFTCGLIIVGTGVWLNWHHDAVAALVSAFWVATSFVVTGAVSAYLLTLHVAHGHAVESLWYLVYDVSATGAIAGLLISRYDVRARRRNRRLSRQERQFRAMFEGTLDALVVTDDDGRYVAANPAAADLFGLPRGELLGKRVADFAADDRAFDRHWTSFLEEGGQRGEFELVRADGEDRTVAFAATANVLPDRHLSAMRDVTERTRRERELREERARVEFLNRLLRHNVLNGMNLVLATLDSLAESVPPERRDDVAAARNRGDEIVELVQTARRLASDVPAAADDRRVDLTGSLTAAVADLRASYPAATVAFDSPEGPLPVHADDVLETVFGQLLTNAVEHNDPETVRVSVDVRVDAETVTVAVADDGVGIPPERHESLFADEPFEHARDWGGFGLSIVDAFVTAYDGRVWAEANEPSGVVFVVELRRADEA